MELKVGRVYRAKRPRPSGMFPVLYNDRMIKWIGAFEIQYDSPTVANGRKYPRVTREAFEKWAAADVTDSTPEGEWNKWQR